MKIGAQLYTLRDFCRTTDDLATTLAKVADMGVSTVQLSGVCEYDPSWMAEQLKKNGLTCDLTHISYDRVLNDVDQLIADHLTFGCAYIGLGSLPGGYSRESAADVQRFCNDVHDAAVRMREKGCMLMYHNHAFEYEKLDNGSNMMEMLSAGMPADLMGFTLDTYWVKYGGEDPVAEIKRLKGRLPRVHFKDMEILADGTRRYCPIGSGILDFETILAELKLAGSEIAYIEQDECFGRDPFDCMKASVDYMRSIGMK